MKPMSDEEIAKRCGLKVSDVRAVLNRLHEYGITAYIRERDKDTGWFSYNWVVNVIKLYDLLGQRKVNGAKREEDNLAYEKSYTFYMCQNPTCSGSSQRIPESEAIVTTYSCGKCGQNLKLFDNTEIIKSIEQKLSNKLPDELTFVREFKQQANRVQKPKKVSPPARKQAKPAKKAMKAKGKNKKRR